MEQYINHNQECLVSPKHTPKKNEDASVQFTKEQEEEPNRNIGTAQSEFLQGAEAEMIPYQRKRRQIYRCPHTDKPHYAKNMCHNCYHRMGKSKLAYACGHPNKAHYSSGMC